MDAKVGLKKQNSKSIDDFRTLEPKRVLRIPMTAKKGNKWIIKQIERKVKRHPKNLVSVGKY